MEPPPAYSSTIHHSHTTHKRVGSRSPAGKAAGRLPRARARRRSPLVTTVAPSHPWLGQHFQGHHLSPVKPSRPPRAPRVASARRLLHFRWWPHSASACEVDSDAVRPPLAMLWVRAGAPQPPLAIPPSRLGQGALVAGESSSEAATPSVSFSLFPHLTSGAH